MTREATAVREVGEAVVWLARLERGAEVLLAREQAGGAGDRLRVGEVVVRRFGEIPVQADRAGGAADAVDRDQVLDEGRAGRVERPGGEAHPAGAAAGRVVVLGHEHAVLVDRQHRVEASCRRCRRSPNHRRSRAGTSTRPSARPVRRRGQPRRAPWSRPRWNRRPSGLGRRPCPGGSGRGWDR